MFFPAFMTSLLHPDPIFRPKSPDTARKKHDGAIYLSAFSPLGIFPAQYYTRIDQALWVWGVTVALIFIPAQFLILDWRVQAVLWSSLSLIAIAITQFDKTAKATVIRFRRIANTHAIVELHHIVTVRVGLHHLSQLQTVAARCARQKDHG